MKNLLSTILLACSIFLISCGDSENVDCGDMYFQIAEAFENYDEAYDDGDCEAMEDYFRKAISSLRKAKNCKNIKEGLADGGYSSIEELIDELKEDYEDEIDECNNPS